jgi:serine/threonine protein kinase
MDNYVGKRLDGRYEIREIIGVGGMAVVYKAYDNIDDRIVAVKILKDEFLANEEFRRRFKNESKAIAVLSHPNIVKVYDVSYGDRLQYIVMEYVEGITLKEYIQQQGVINYREAVFFVMQILRALQHAHDKGIVHRDIKPQNIMLLENGAIKVTDFGIARFSRSETRTMTDSTIGSVHYISPEQARGDVTDDKADIYSVGVMFYEMLTGKLPFESDNTVSVAIMQLQQDPVMPREINPEIPVGLEQIVIKAMQKNIHDRYQSAAEMLLDLEEFKRNPSISFDYDYKNTEPTKYIPTVAQKTQVIDSAAEIENDNSEPVVKNRTIPILVGVIAALIVVLGVAFGVLYHFGYITGKVKEKVPDFSGKIYSEDTFASEYPKFTFEVTQQVNADSTPNSVLSQDPAAGTKIDPQKTVIKLVIATNSEMVEVPAKLVGSDYVSAVTKLTQAGFKVKEKEVSAQDYSSLESGTVVKVSPTEGTKVAVGSTITIEYVSYDSSSKELIKVPDVTGLTEAGAKQALVSSGFTVTENKEYSNTVKVGYVISNTFAGSKIPKGSAITITVSKGELVEQTTSVSVNLPSTGGSGKMSVTLDGTNILTNDVTLDGSSKSFEVKGSESTSVLKVFIDDKLIYKCNINFTTTPVKISNETTYSMEPTTSKKVKMPNLIGKTKEEAMQILTADGFNSITPSGDGATVTAQYPDPNSNVDVSTSVTITLGA